jgi:hypothetical protein
MGGGYDAQDSIDFQIVLFPCLAQDSGKVGSWNGGGINSHVYRSKALSAAGFAAAGVHAAMACPSIQAKFRDRASGKPPPRRFKGRVGAVMYRSTRWCDLYHRDLQQQY